MTRLAVLAVLSLLLAACAGAGDDDRAAQAVGSTTSEPGLAETEPAEPGPEGTETDLEPAGTEPAGTEPAGTDPGSGATSSTPEALDFEASLVGGGTFRGSDHDGRDVALWFWAPW